MIGTKRRLLAVVVMGGWVLGPLGACADGAGDSTAHGRAGEGGANDGGDWPDGPGGTSGSAGSACVAQCTGKQCGDDGCGASCPPGCASGETCESGACVPSCSGSWTTPVPGVDPSEILVDGTTLYLAGKKADQPWFGRISACSGTGLVQSAPDLGAGATGGPFGLVQAGASLYAVGAVTPGAADSGDGWFARLDPTSLAASWLNLASPSANRDLLYDVAVAGSGGLWAVGEGNVGGGEQAWVAKLSASGAACSFLLGASPGKLWGVAPDGGDVYVAGREGSGVVVHRFVDGACTPGPGCSCAPAASSPAISYPGAVFTEARAIVARAGVVHLAGLADPGDGNHLAFVMRVDVETGNVLGTFEWNPTASTDGFLDVATDDDRLYVGGGKGYDGSWPNAVPALVALPHPLPQNAVPIWLLSPSSGNAVSSLAIDPDTADGLYPILLDASTTPASAVVLRCTKSGVCP